MTLTAPFRGGLSSVGYDLVYVIPVYNTKFDDSRFCHSGDMTSDIEIDNGSCITDHAHFSGGLSSVSYDLI